MRAACERYLYALGDYLQAELPPLIASFEPGPELPPLESEALRRFQASLQPVDLDRLWSAVRSEPESDAACWKLSRALEAAGDPRGEFMRLQLSDSEPTRQQELLQAHWRDWLDGLGPFVARKQDVEFQRGLLSAVSVGGVAQSLAADVPEALIRAPAWSSLRRVAFPYQPAAALGVLAQLDRIPDEVLGVPPEGLSKLSCRMLGLVGFEPGHLALLSDVSPDLRNLRLLEPSPLQPAHLARVWSALPALEHFAWEFPERAASWANYIDTVRSHPPGPALKTLLLEFRGWSLQFWRGSSGAFDHLRLVETPTYDNPLALLVRRLGTRESGLQHLRWVQVALRPVTKRRQRKRVERLIKELEARCEGSLVE